MKLHLSVALAVCLPIASTFAGELDPIVEPPPPTFDEPGLTRPVIDPIDLFTGGVSGGVRAAARSAATGAILAGEAAVGFVKGVITKAATSTAKGVLSSQRDSDPGPDEEPAPRARAYGGGGSDGPSHRTGGDSFGGSPSYDIPPSLRGFNPTAPIPWSDNAPSAPLYNGGGGGGGGGAILGDDWWIKREQV